MAQALKFSRPVLGQKIYGHATQEYQFIVELIVCNKTILLNFININ